VKEEERLAEKQFVAMIELEFLLFISHLTIYREALRTTIEKSLKDEFDLLQSSFISRFFSFSDSILFVSLSQNVYTCGLQYYKQTTF
jgi:hypothetical protein